MSQLTFTGLGLQSLAPEPWGKRLARARVNAGYGLRDVEAILAPHVSRAGLARLETLDEVPERRAHRGQAVMVLVLYNVDPADFDLGPEDLPPATDLRALIGLRSARSGWLSGIALRLVRAS